MKNIALIAAFAIAMVSCKNDDDATPANTTVDFTFTQNWDGTSITNADFDTTTYTNANGEELTLSKLVYLISDITFTSSTGVVYDAGDYNLIDVRQGTNLTFTPDVQIPEGTYTVSFTFGFDDEDNIDGVYLDLNSADSGWGVPGPLGGGYHYMRMEGKFIDNTSTETTFQYHTIRANSHTTLPPGPGTLDELQDTSFEVNLGQVTVSNNTNVEIKMNVAEWFKNPNQWDLNVWHSTLMPNFDAQIDMHENGSNGVFSLGAVTQ